jgi:NTP pyrophosphatase (non-canonical NTP hydrolase)
MKFNVEKFLKDAADHPSNLIVSPAQVSAITKWTEEKSISTLCKLAYETAKSKGWHDEERETGTMLALIHSEVSEALEADRKGKVEHFAEELADVCIRIFDLCGLKEIDLEAAILKKMEFNKTRSYKHGGKAY